MDKKKVRQKSRVETAQREHDLLIRKPNVISRGRMSRVVRFHVQKLGGRFRAQKKRAGADQALNACVRAYVHRAADFALALVACSKGINIIPAKAQMAVKMIKFQNPLPPIADLDVFLKK